MNWANSTCGVVEAMSMQAQRGTFMGTKADMRPILKSSSPVTGWMLTSTFFLCVHMSASDIPSGFLPVALKDSRAFCDACTAALVSSSVRGSMYSYMPRRRPLNVDWSYFVVAMVKAGTPSAPAPAPPSARASWGLYSRAPAAQVATAPPAAKRQRSAWFSTEPQAGAAPEAQLRAPRRPAARRAKVLEANIDIAISPLACPRKREIGL
mmetsp:Transcript_72480/g.235428  ORF Transcript_72480/g.235428 Transcript_72480/m.235428 type:complete len:209 (-) Transcript_72480:13-639(-)